jgi:hypothetical protein
VFGVKAAGDVQKSEHYKRRGNYQSHFAEYGSDYQACKREGRKSQLTDKARKNRFFHKALTLLF